MTHILHESYKETLRIREQAKDPRIVSFLDYYLKIHPKTSLPGRAHFDPFDVPSSLPSVTLMDVERDPFRFRYRVMGTDVTYNMDFDGTGKYLDEVVPGVETQFPHIDRVSVVETGFPVHRLGQASISFRTDFADLERIHFPLASDGITVDMVLSIFIYFAEGK